MAVNPELWNLSFHCNVFHYYDCLSTSAPVFELLDLANLLFQPAVLNSEITANQHKRYQPRELKPTARNWTKVRKELQAGELSTLLFGSLAPNGTMQLGIAFHMSSELDRRRDPTAGRHADCVHLWVGHKLIRDGTVTLGMCEEFMQTVWEKLEGAYGFADMFITHRTGRVSPLEENEAPYVMKAHVYTSKVMLPSVDLRRRVPDSYWLNFLNAEHLAMLSNIEQFERNLQVRLPQARVRKLPRAGVAIQISPSPIYDDVSVWQGDHDALTELLTPILSM